jgi:hypothetical protein
LYEVYFDHDGYSLVLWFSVVVREVNKWNEFKKRLRST